MKRPTNNPLLWQAVVILLPIFILAGLGAFYLRQDRILVRHEAEERGRVLADDVLNHVWQRLTSLGGIGHDRGFRVDNAGNLLDPPPFERTPVPQPLNFDLLTPEQARLWSTLSTAKSLQAFLATEPSAEFVAIAQYRLALAYATEKHVAEAAKAYRAVYDKFPDAVGESGLPLTPLAGLKALELGLEDDEQERSRPLTWDILCRDAIEHPTALTSLLLERARQAGKLPDSLAAQWQRHEDLRELYRSSRAQIASATSPLFWMRSGSERSLASRIAENPTNYWIGMRTIVLAPPNRQIGLGQRQGANAIPVQIPSLRGSRQEEIGMHLARDANPAPSLRPTPLDTFVNVPLPDYFGISIDVAGETALSTRNLPASFPDATGPHGSAVNPTEVLASARRMENGQELLKVSIHLLSPKELFARQKQRVFWFGALIAVSTTAAIIGLISARRSFDKQLRLAEMKDNFVSSVSHELRAPIASVRLMAESLETGRVHEPQKQQEYFRFIGQECRRLSALIQNVLDFSRIDQGHKQYEFESADVERMIEETMKTMEPPAAERQIRLRFASGNRPIPYAILDARAMQQALINLIDNAIKHSPPGSEIIVSSASGDNPPTLEISVEDHGEGIPAAEHERIFERFYRVGSELRRRTPGAGIGLSIVKHIVEGHGGHVRVQSEVGRGSRFTMEIPLKQ